MAEKVGLRLKSMRGREGKIKEKRARPRVREW